MKALTLKTLFLLASLGLASGHARAEDIDVFAGAGANAALPNVLFVLDNAASFSESVGSFTCTYVASAGGGTPSLTGTSAGIQQCALVNAISALPDNPPTVNIGLMVFNENQMTGSPVVFAGTGAENPLDCGNGTGGCLVQPLAEMNSTVKGRLITFIKSWKVSGTSTGLVPGPASFNIKANTKRTAQTMQEAWAYYAGRTGLSGVNYAGIQPQSGCQQNYVIFIGSAVGQPGTPGDGGSADAVGALSAAGATAAQLQPIDTGTYPSTALCNDPNNPYTMGTHNNSSGLYGDEWARFMKNSDLYPTIQDQQNITTFTVGVLDPATCKPDYPALLTTMAREGGGEYFSSTSYQELVDAIATILNKIQAVNSAFASASLPISVNTQGTFLNQIFVGQFRPDADAKPRWMGNLKQYQFGVEFGLDANGDPDPNKLQLFLADADGQKAIAGAVAGEETTGFISVEARSFWTKKDLATLPDNIGGFWVNNKQGFAAGFDSPDGNIVEKGGVHQQIRLENLQTDYAASPAAPRRLYTCLGSNCGTTTLLSDPSNAFATSNTNLTATALGITNPVNTADITSILRTSGTGTAADGKVTVTLAAVPSPAILDPTTASISGSASGQYDYSLSGKSPSHTTGTTVVTYTLPAETPPVTPAAGYTAAKLGAGSTESVDVTSLTRSSNAGRITVTATLQQPFASGSPLIGDSITIGNSSGYDGPHIVTSVNGNDFQFTMSDSPSVYGGGGDIWVGPSCQKTGPTAGRNCEGIGASNSNDPATLPVPGLVRGVNTTLSATSHILMVNFTAGSGGTTIPFATGNAAKIQNATSSLYNSTTGYPIVATGTGCSVTVIDPTSGSTRLYTGTADTATKKYSLCLDLGAGFSLTPALTANGATSSPQTQASRASPGASKDIISMSRGTSTCPGSKFATVTARTSSAHTLVPGDKVIVGNPSPGADEAAYNGTFDVVTTPTTDTFTFQVPTSPASPASSACTDSTPGMKLSYQDTAGGVSATDLIRWVRGANNIGDEKSPGNGITIRPSIHGDVLHSRPTVIAYPLPVDPDNPANTGNVVVFYGGNDGVFRAINGSNKETGTDGFIGGVPPGGELWGFIPSEFYSKLQRLYFNTPVVKLHNTNLTLFPDAKPKDYFFDGAIGVFQDNATNKAIIYLSARRGGRIIYAIDVSDPVAPVFLWKKGCSSTDNTTCVADFSELGQTWSHPKPALVKGHTNPVLIFGAGYDANEDTEPPTADTMGRGIFILDAFNGNVLWRAGPGGSGGPGDVDSCTGTTCLLRDMNYAIPSDVTLVDRIPDGFIDRLYVGDLGGNIWRVDLEPAGGNTPAFWQATKFASVGGASTDTTKRKIFFPPDVVTTKNFDAVLVPTGDREHPVYKDPVLNPNASVKIINRFYMLKDLKTGSDACSGSCPTPIADNTSSTADVQPTAPGSSVLFKAGTTDVNGDFIPYDDTGSGFYITLKNGTEIGEKGVNAPTTIGGNTFFGTNTPIPPSNTICQANLGVARGYSVNVVTGETKFVEFEGGGLPPSPVSGLVSVEVDGETKLIPFLIGGGNPDPDCIGPDCTSALGGLKPPIPIKAIRSRTFWYREHDKK